MSKSAAKSGPHPAIFPVRDGVLCERDDTISAADRAGSLISGASLGLSLLAEMGAPIILLAGRRLAAGDGAQNSWTCNRQLGAGITRTVIVDQGAEGRLHPGRALAHTLRRAARAHDLDISSSVLICDTWCDATAASEVGCQPILVMTGRGREQMMLPQYVAGRAQVWYAADLAMAALSARTHLEQIGVRLPIPTRAASSQRVERRHARTVA
jgi:HAD-hyrolase-like protein